MSALVTLAAKRLLLLGDVHGRLERVRRLLDRAGLLTLDGLRVGPSDVLVQVGDLIDRFDPARPEDLGPLELPLAAAVPDPREDARSAGAPPLSLGAALDGEWPGGAEAWPAALRAEERRAAMAALGSLACVRLFHEAARAQPGRVVVLLGNHELDLLRGRFLYAAREKQYLLALLGLDAAAIAQHAAQGLPLAEVLGAAPELRWLGGLPVLARVSCPGPEGEVLAVHGGPPAALIGALETLGIQHLADLVGWIDRAHDSGFHPDAFTEGSCLLSPDAPEDDAVARPHLAQRLLNLAAADVLAVGHSPFLHAPKGRWVDLLDARRRMLVERPARLGPRGALVKLDTNLKRGGPAWLVVREVPAEEGGARGPWSALRDDGLGEALDPTAPGPGAPGPGASASSVAEGDARPPAPEGVDHEAHRAASACCAALEEGGDAARATRLRTLIPRLLGRGLTDLAPVLAVGAAAEALEREERLARLEALAEAARERAAALAHEVEALLAARENAEAGDERGAREVNGERGEREVNGDRGEREVDGERGEREVDGDRGERGEREVDGERGERAVVLLPTPDALRVDGVSLHLAPLAVESVLRQRRSAGRARWPVLTLSYVERGGAAHLRLHWFAASGGAPRDALCALASWPPEPAEVRALAAAFAEEARREDALEGGWIPEATPRFTTALPSAARPTRAEGPRPSARWAKLRPGPALGGAVADALRTWAARNRDRLARLEDAGEAWDDVDRLEVRALLDAGAPRADRALIAPSEPTSAEAPVGRPPSPPGSAADPSAERSDRAGARGVVLQRLGAGPQAPWVPADTSLQAPAARFLVQDDAGAWREHPALLLERLGLGGVVQLWSGVAHEVESLLRLGELDGLGRGLERAGPESPIWRRGCHLFTTPHREAAAPFAYKGRVLEFEVPRAALVDAVAAGLLTVNLFLADDAQPLDPHATFGALDVAAEVVALGEAGVSWLLGHRT